MKLAEGRRRVVIEGVHPEIDGGRFPIKRAIGDQVVVEADAFTDGQDVVRVELLHRRGAERRWTAVGMQALPNDRFRGSFDLPEQGHYRYTLRAWLDRFASWRRDLAKWVDADQDLSVDLQFGAALVARAAARASGPSARVLRSLARELGEGTQAAVRRALDPDVSALMSAHPDRRWATRYQRVLAVVVDRERARFSTWYELFPRSASGEGRRHGTFDDVRKRLPDLARMGFDVLYLPPIHPIGRTHRKGRNNSTQTEPDDPGSPWAIGSTEGGHTAIHPELGTMDDFEALVDEAERSGMEVALDLAFQCSPDHPWVRQHPQWFRHRSDGTIQYAENPPKRYQDIYPLDFETEDWRGLWEALKDVVSFWVRHGVRVFRVDNPHTKPFAFWEWLISEVKADHPEVLFLSEAFTRPKVMYRLAKLGFTQSYTYFAWRRTKWELTEYFTELTRTDIREFFRPNLWPNTPDILTEQLQTGGRPVFVQRLMLAATLGASYGIYGPAFELMENRPLHAGSEEYLNSEKYEVRQWRLDDPQSLAELVTLINGIRQDNPALQQDRTLRFHDIDNDLLLAYSKIDPATGNVALVVVNLDPAHVQAGWVELPLDDMGIRPDLPYQVHDLVTGARYLWDGPRNFVELNPQIMPAHIFGLRRRVRTEHDYEYFM